VVDLYELGVKGDYVAIEPKKGLLSVKTMPAFVLRKLRWVYRCDCLEMPVVVNQVVENGIYITQPQQGERSP
jgi:hypothetical protein